MILGITGSFGSGKTTVSNIFKKYGFEVINADKLYHGVYNKNKALRNKIKKEIDKIRKYNKEARIIVDVPLLFEAKMQNMFDKIIVVKCDEKEQIERLLKKKKYSKKEINRIISSQMPFGEKVKEADFVVDNSQSLKYAEKQINSLADSMQKP